MNYLRNRNLFLTFFVFWEFRFNLEEFQKKDDPHS